MSPWTRRAVLGALAGSVACAARRDDLPDVALPDGPPPPSGPARVVLADLASDTRPGVRGRALAGLVRGLPAEDVLRWSTQGTYDPDPWVQRVVIRALVDRGDAFGREQVLALLSRRSADGYAVAEGVHRLLDDGVSPPAEAVAAVWPEQRPWDAAPRALVALRQGDAVAERMLDMALSSGLVRMDPAFLGRLAAHGPPSLADAIGRGVARMEELAETVDPVLMLWEDEAARARVIRGLRSADPYTARTSLDVFRHAREAAHVRKALQAAARAADGDVRVAARALLRPTATTLGRGVDASRGYAAEVVLQDGLARVDGASRRAVVAAALTHPDPGVLEQAAVAVQRYRVQGLSALLAPLRAHRAPALRAAVAGADLVMSMTPEVAG